MVWSWQRETVTQLRRQLGHSSIEFRDRVAELLLPGLVLGELQLALHLCSRQTARLDLVSALRVAALDRLACVLSFLFKFVDDIVIRVVADGSGAILDLRSKSRDGKGDLGVNAGRIVAFLQAFGH